MILFLVVFSLALSGGLGAPTAAYKFVKCNPEGNQANCITHQSANLEWSPDLPARLPATAAQYLEAEPVEDEHDPEQEMGEEDDVEDEEYEEEYESPEEGESPVVALSEVGSGDEGSAFMADWATPADTGSGELLAKNYEPNKGGRKNRKGAFWSLLDEQKPAMEEMKEDQLL